MGAPLPDEQAALLAAIVADPDADAPRLVYADWLQEHGDEEQAQFIRDSIALAGMKPRAKGRKALQARLEKLASTRGEAWVNGIGLGYAPVGWGGVFVRGLVENPVYWDLDAFLGEAQTLFARLPVRSLWISHAGQGFRLAALRAMAAMPGLARLRRLELFNDNAAELSLAGWNALIRSPYLSGLREFSPMGLGLSDEHLFALAACPNMAALKRLDLSDNDITSEGQRAILMSSHLSGLEQLSLSNGYDIADSDLIDLVVERFGSESPLFQSLSD